MENLTRELSSKSRDLGRTVLDAMYAYDPFWEDRFGDRGRKMADQDTGYHVAYLVEALDAGDPTVFTNYTKWLRTLLVSRGMCSQHVVDHFARLEGAIRAEIKDAAPATDLLAMGRDVLRYVDGAAGAIEERSRDIADRAAVELSGCSVVTLAGARPADSARARHEMIHLLSFLADALGARRPELFQAYVQWLDDFRRRHGIEKERVRTILSWLEARLVDVAEAREFVERAAAALTSSPDEGATSARGATER